MHRLQRAGWAPAWATPAAGRTRRGASALLARILPVPVAAALQRIVARLPVGRRSLVLLAPALVLLTGAGAPLSAGEEGTAVWRSPHAEALRAHRDQAPLPDLLGDGGPPTVPLRAAKGAAARPVVFGFLPYWIDQTYYHSIDWELLSHVAPFSVEVNPDGGLGDAHGWPWTGLVDTAHAHGVRVVLTATLFGDRPVLALVGDSTRWPRFFEAIGDRVLAGDADGLIVDFEGPGANGWPRRIPGFLTALTASLHARIPGSQVGFAAPPVDWAARWDARALAVSCDYLFLMGYAWTGSWSDHSGPTAPLTGGSRNLTTTLTDARDYGDVTREHPERLILGVPFYGCRWRTVGPEARAATSEFLDYPRFWETALGVEKYEALWDAASRTPWYRYREGGAWVQVWHDDPASLGFKFDLALAHGLRGVGVWALGYESRRPETWQLIAARMGRRALPPTAVVDAAAGPGALRLVPAWPNPFNGAVHLRAELPGAGVAGLAVYDLLGQPLRVWRWRQAAAGTVTRTWEATDAAGRAAASGVYVEELRFRARGGAERVLRGRLVLAR